MFWVGVADTENAWIHSGTSPVLVMNVFPEMVLQ